MLTSVAHILKKERIWSLGHGCDFAQVLERTHFVWLFHGLPGKVVLLILLIFRKVSSLLPTLNLNLELSFPHSLETANRNVFWKMEEH